MEIDVKLNIGDIVNHKGDKMNGRVVSRKARKTTLRGSMEAEAFIIEYQVNWDDGESSWNTYGSLVKSEQ